MFTSIGRTYLKYRDLGYFLSGLSYGWASQDASLDRNRVFLADLAVGGGHSGSPTVNRDGEILGVNFLAQEPHNGESLSYFDVVGSLSSTHILESVTNSLGERHAHQVFNCSN
jgi:S1-C subfamily serine protease